MHTGYLPRLQNKSGGHKQDQKKKKGTGNATSNQNKFRIAAVRPDTIVKNFLRMLILIRYTVLVEPNSKILH